MKNFTTLLFLLASLVGYAQTNEQEPNNSYKTANYFAQGDTKPGVFRPHRIRIIMLPVSLLTAH